VLRWGYVDQKHTDNLKCTLTTLEQLFECFPDLKNSEYAEFDKIVKLWLAA
jgi:hypothetical protein